MRISFVMNFYPRVPVGGMKVIHEYANCLAENGIEVKMYYYYSAEFVSEKYHLPDWLRLLIMRYRIEVMSMSWIKLHKNVRKYGITKIINNQIADADIVVATAISTAVPVYNLNTNKGKKVYLIQDYENWHDTDEEVNSTYSLGFHNIVVANWLKQTVDKYSTEPSILISNSINTEIFCMKQPLQSREEHTVVFQFREAEHKGCKYALETIRFLEVMYDDLKVYVISIDPKPIDLPKSCVFMSKLTPEEVADVNNKAQVFMCSSVEEGFGLPGLEAMACGCALVSTEYRGVLEYAVDKKNALLSPIRDSETMANNIIKLFEDMELRKTLISEGMKTAKGRSISITGQLFCDTLYDL